MSAIHMNSPVARKRWSAAAGDVIARRWMSTRSRTSTTSSPILGMPAHVAAQQSSDHLHRAQVVAGQQRAEHGTGQDRRQRRRAPRAGRRLGARPGGLLGHGLGSAVGREARRVGVGPQGLVGDAVVAVRRRAGGVGRRRHHDAADACGNGGLDDPRRPVAGDRDHRVGVPRIVGAERRRHVEHGSAAGNGFVPAAVGREVGDHEAQPGPGVDGRRHGGGHGRLLGRVTHRGADVVAPAQQLDDAPLSDEAGSTGHQHGRCHGERR